MMLKQTYIIYVSSQKTRHQKLNSYPVMNSLVKTEDGTCHFLTLNRARKSRTTLQNKVRLKVLPEQLTLSVNTSVT